MADETPDTETSAAPAADAAVKPPRKRAPRKRTAAATAAPAQPEPAAESGSAPETASDAAASEQRPTPAKRARKATARRAVPPVFDSGTLTPSAEGAATIAASTGDLAAPQVLPSEAPPAETSAFDAPSVEASLVEESPEAGRPAKRAPRKRAAKAKPAPATAEVAEPNTAEVAEAVESAFSPTLAPMPVLFQPPAETAPRRRGSRTPRKAVAPQPEPALEVDVDLVADEFEDSALATFDDFEIERDEADRDDADRDDADRDDADASDDSDASDKESPDAPESDAQGSRRRRRRGRRGRGPRVAEGDADSSSEDDSDAEDDSSESEPDAEESDAGLSPSARRRRRRRRSTAAGDAELEGDDPPNTEVHVREPKSSGRGGSAADSDGVRGVRGSTRLEAKRQRRRDSRDSGRRRAPILTESEFLARRESVERVMAVYQTADRTQIAVLEDGILVEHYVTRESAASAVGNVYLGRVQNVLPSMEAAFVDIGRGRNGVLYAGEVNWDAAGLEGKSRSIENALNSGDAVLVQVTKDPIGHKGARLTSQISLPGRFVVYVPGGGMTGISRKLPDTERTRLKAILKKVVPDEAGVIVRTAAEGASEADLISDVERLKAQWELIQAKNAAPSNAPTLVYGEPDLAIRVVRDVFNDDFSRLIVSGSESYATLTGYIGDIAPALRERISLHTGESDLFADLRVDEQLAKALDRKVWLPSGGSLVIDRTEAMTVVDVNTGKYTGSGGNLEQTVTRNNLEAAEEVVRQLRLRDIGGIVVIDFIDMVLESNRELVLRRLTECLGRDRTKHQVAEVTSLGLVQMTRKRVGEGLLEAFSEPCEHCKGRGVILHSEPTFHESEVSADTDDERPGRSRRGRRAKSGGQAVDPEIEAVAQSQRRSAAAAIAAIAAATAPKTAAGDEVDGEPAVGADALREKALGDGAGGDGAGGDGAGGDGAGGDGAGGDGAGGDAAGDDSVADEATMDEVATDATSADDALPPERPQPPERLDHGSAHGALADNRSAAAEGKAKGSDAVASQGADGLAEHDAEQASGTADARTTAPVTGATRPRRRRAASRPAGPPVAATAASN